MFVEVVEVRIDVAIPAVFRHMAEVQGHRVRGFVEGRPEPTIEAFPVPGIGPDAWEVWIEGEGRVVTVDRMEEAVRDVRMDFIVAQCVMRFKGED